MHSSIRILALALALATGASGAAAQSDSASGPAQRASDARQARRQAAFERIDANHDGVLSSEEFAAHAQALRARIDARRRPGVNPPAALAPSGSRAPHAGPPPRGFERGAGRGAFERGPGFGGREARWRRFERRHPALAQAVRGSCGGSCRRN